MTAFYHWRCNVCCCS